MGRRMRTLRQAMRMRTAAVPSRRRSRPAFPIVLFAAVALLAACGGGNGDSDEDLAAIDAAALIVASAARMEQVERFHFDLAFSGGGAEIIRGLTMQRAEGDFAGVDNMQLELSASLGPLSADIEMRIVDGVGWITNPLTGRWESEDFSIADLFDLATGVTALMRSAADPRVEGRESAGGVDSYRLEATLRSDDVTLLANVLGGQTLEATVWIAVDDPLVHRIDLRGPLFAAGEDVRLRLSLSAHDERVEIVAPR